MSAKDGALGTPGRPPSGKICSKRIATVARLALAYVLGSYLFYGVALLLILALSYIDSGGSVTSEDLLFGHVTPLLGL